MNRANAFSANNVLILIILTLNMPAIKNYLSLVKFSHTLFAMPFALIGFFWAVHDIHSFAAFPWLLLVQMVLCMVFARNAAMGFNRYIDRQFDAMNTRTANREIPTGTIQPRTALVFVLVNCVLFISTTYFINSLTFYLSPIALLVVLGYSYTKRFTWLCHFVLGLGLAIAPMGAYIVVANDFAVAPLLYSALVLLWVGGFDILYALPDDTFDQATGLHSVPAHMGRRNALLLSAAVHLLAAVLVLLIGCSFDRGAFYWVGAVLFIGLLTYQHLIVTPTNLIRLNAAFFTTNGIASVCYAAFTVVDLL